MLRRKGSEERKTSADGVGRGGRFWSNDGALGALGTKRTA
jgi:hypothetical protein